MTTYIAAYDTEHPACLKALPKIVDIHERFEMPATFFLVARLLDDGEQVCRRLLGDNPLFEIGCHSYTHAILRDHGVGGKPVPKDQYFREVVESKERIEQVFGREVFGFRPPYSFSTGLCGAPDLLSLCDRAGYRYISSMAWGPGDSLPALVNRPFTYAEDGFPGLWEIPPCGWHDNVLKGNTKLEKHPLVLFPAPMPEAVPTGYVATPEEEFAVDRLFIDKAVNDGVPQVSLIWHPWSIDKFDPEMKMLELVFSYVCERGLGASTFADFVDALRTA